MTARISKIAGFLLLTLPCFSQDTEPRRWSHLPIEANFAGAAYAYTQGDLYLNPVLGIENGEFDLQTGVVKYIHSFELLGKSARVDLWQPYQSGVWNSLLKGVPAEVERDGLADSLLRFAINLYGAPPLAGKKFADYRANATHETIIGTGLLVQVQTGEYFEDKLINLGSNRFTFTLQLCVVHNRGKWSGELSTSASLSTDNNEYFKCKTLGDDIYLIAQGHLIYTFLPGLWLSASTGYGLGGESTIDGNPTGDSKSNLGWGLSISIPVNRDFGFKIAYIRTRTQGDMGSAMDTFIIGCSVM